MNNDLQAVLVRIERDNTRTRRLATIALAVAAAAAGLSRSDAVGAQEPDEKETVIAAHQIVADRIDARRLFLHDENGRKTPMLISSGDTGGAQLILYGENEDSMVVLHTELLSIDSPRGKFSFRHSQMMLGEVENSNFFNGPKQKISANRDGHAAALKINDVGIGDPTGQ